MVVDRTTDWHESCSIKIKYYHPVISTHKPHPSQHTHTHHTHTPHCHTGHIHLHIYPRLRLNLKLDATWSAIGNPPPGALSCKAAAYSSGGRDRLRCPKAPNQGGGAHWFGLLITKTPRGTQLERRRRDPLVSQLPCCQLIILLLAHYPAASSLSCCLLIILLPAHYPAASSSSLALQPAAVRAQCSSHSGQSEAHFRSE